MPILINNEQQMQSITFKDAIAALEHGVRQLAEGNAIRRPRIDNLIPTSREGEFLSFSSMEGGIRDPGYYAIRMKPDVISWPVVNGKRRRVTYNSKPGLYGGMVLLFSVDNAEFLAILNDGYIQHVRVAATAALGAKFLARPDSHVMGIIGSGGMARTFAEAFCEVRDIQRIQVYSRTRANLDEYIQEMSAKLSCEIVAVDSPQAAVRGADIVNACTNSLEPVIDADWIEPGTHLSNVTTYEFGPDVNHRIDTVGLLVQRIAPRLGDFADDDFAIRVNVMTYAAGTQEERNMIPGTSWDTQGIQNRVERHPNAKYVDCVDWKTGQRYQRSNRDEVTMLANAVFGTREGDIGLSAGIQGIQFSSIGGRIFENAKRNGLGTELPHELFLQTIPT